MNSTLAHPEVPRKIILKVADEVWIATALLHREHADRKDFTVQEIIARARSENITGTLRPGVSVHAYLHCVANRPPNSAQYRMLYATEESARRLFRQSDDADPRRKGKITPEAEDVPPQYRHLLDWYRNEYAGLGLSRIFWDTNIFIYLMEGSGGNHDLARKLLDRMFARRDELITSTMTLGELLVKPLEANRLDLAQRYESLLGSRGVCVVNFDRNAARIYARLRLDRSIRPPDAIQLSCAAAAATNLFVTNDARLSQKTVSGVDFIVPLEKVFL